MEKPKKQNNIQTLTILSIVSIFIFFIVALFGTIFVGRIADIFVPSVMESTGYSRQYVHHHLTLKIISIIPLTGIFLGLAAIIRNKISKGKYESVKLASFTILFNLMIYFITIPNLIKYASGPVKFDPREDLKSLYLAQKIYHANNGTYAKTFEELQWSHPNPRWYAFYLSPDEAIQLTRAGPYSLPSGINPFVEKEKYFVIAVGNIDRDEVLDVWYIDENKIMKCIVSDCDLDIWPEWVWREDD